MNIAHVQNFSHLYDQSKLLQQWNKLHEYKYFVARVLLDTPQLAFLHTQYKSAVHKAGHSNCCERVNGLILCGWRGIHTKHVAFKSQKLGIVDVFILRYKQLILSTVLKRNTMTRVKNYDSQWVLPTMYIKYCIPGRWPVFPTIPINDKHFIFYWSSIF